MSDNDATQTRQDDATKQLRTMLDERGVGWRKWDYFGIDIGTIFSASGIEWIVIWDPKANNLSIANYKINHTAEQIIAATLGNGTCREVKVTTKPNMWGFDDYFCGHCGRRLTSVANGLNEHFPVYCEDCGTKAVYE